MACTIHRYGFFAAIHFDTTDRHAAIGDITRHHKRTRCSNRIDDHLLTIGAVAVTQANNGNSFVDDDFVHSCSAGTSGCCERRSRVCTLCNRHCGTRICSCNGSTNAGVNGLGHSGVVVCRVCHIGRDGQCTTAQAADVSRPSARGCVVSGIHSGMPGHTITHLHNSRADVRSNAA